MAVPAETVFEVRIQPVDQRVEVRWSGGNGVIYSALRGEWAGASPPKPVMDQVKAALRLVPGAFPARRSTPKK